MNMIRDMINVLLGILFMMVSLILVGLIWTIPAVATVYIVKLFFGE